MRPSAFRWIVKLTGGKVDSRFSHCPAGSIVPAGVGAVQAKAASRMAIAGMRWARMWQGSQGAVSEQVFVVPANATMGYSRARAGGVSIIRIKATGLREHHVSGVAAKPCRGPWCISRPVGASLTETFCTHGGDPFTIDRDDVKLRAGD